jgi:hypothetical protein
VLTSIPAGLIVFGNRKARLKAQLANDEEAQINKSTLPISTYRTLIVAVTFR